ncbi:MAG: PAS domain-containing sensor histidine kinase [bacterium]
MDKNKFNKIEKRQLTEQLNDANLRLKNIIESTDVGTWEWNIKTGEMVFSDKWAEILGYPISDIGPNNIQTLEKISHPDDFAKASALIKQHIAGELPYYKHENRVKHKHGHWVWVCERGCVASFDEDGNPLTMFGTHTDITKRKQIEQALENYINTLNHDLRSPLAIIIGYSSFLLDESLSPEEIKKFAMIINSTGKKMLKMMESYLLLAKIEKGQDILGKKPKTVVEVMEGVKRIFSDIKGSKKINVHLKDLENKPVDSGLMKKTILIDEILFDSLVDNLLRNAVDASAESDGEVSVNIFQDNDFLRLSFFNKGEISKEIQKRLFKKFISNKKNGTGIGLYSVKLIARAHGGDIQYQSVPGGTRFIVKVPFD